MYAKIFQQIYDSSIVEKPEVRFTFMDLQVLADRDGVVDMTYEAIARRTNRPIEVIRATIAELEAPDPQSRTPDADGVRLIRIDTHRDWGWCIINFDRFHKLANESERRASTRDRVNRFREKTRGNPQCNAPVTPCNAPKRPVTPKKDVDVDVDVDANVNTRNNLSPPDGGGDVPKLPKKKIDKGSFDDFWEEYPKKIAKGAARKAWGKSAKLRPDFITLMESLDDQKLSEQWIKDGGQYIPMPTTWLNQERWDDHLAEAANIFKPREFTEEDTRIMQELRDTLTLEEFQHLGFPDEESKAMILAEVMERERLKEEAASD